MRDLCKFKKDYAFAYLSNYIKYYIKDELNFGKKNLDIIFDEINAEMVMIIQTKDEDKLIDIIRKKSAIFNMINVSPL